MYVEFPENALSNLRICELANNRPIVSMIEFDLYFFFYFYPLVEPGMLCSLCHGFSHYRADDCPVLKAKIEEKEAARNDSKTTEESSIPNLEKNTKKLSEQCKCHKKPCVGKHHGCRRYGGDIKHCPAVCLEAEEEDKYLYGEVVGDSKSYRAERLNTMESIITLRGSSKVKTRLPSVLTKVTETSGKKNTLESKVAPRRADVKPKFKPTSGLTDVKVQSTCTKQVQESQSNPQKTLNDSSKRSTIKLNLSAKPKITANSKPISTKESQVTSKPQTSTTPKEVKKEVKGQATSVATKGQHLSKSTEIKVKEERNNTVPTLGNVKTRKQVWIIGDGTAHQAVLHACKKPGGDTLGLRKDNLSLSWQVHNMAKLANLRDLLTKMLKMAPAGPPDFLVIHLGLLDIQTPERRSDYDLICEAVATLQELVPKCIPIWSEIILQTEQLEKQNCQPKNKPRQSLNEKLSHELLKLKGKVICHTHYKKKPHLYKQDQDGVLSEAGLDKFLMDLKEGLKYFQRPDAKDLYENTGKN